MTASGIRAAVNREGGFGDDLTDDEQVELFAEVAGIEARSFDKPREWSKKGRKPGSRNLTTRRVVEYIQKTQRDPLVALASIVTMKPSEIRAEFYLDGKDAAEFWRKCCEAVLPYLHSRKPLAVEIDAPPQFPEINIFFGAMAAAAANGGHIADDDDAENPFIITEQKQALIEGQGNEVA